MDITAKVITVLPIESGTSKSGNAWQKQSFVVETSGKYPKKICFQIFGNKVGECPAVGDEVKVSFDAESHEFNGRWYTQLDVWKVEKVGAATQSQPLTQPQAPTQSQPQHTLPLGDDLPF